MSTSRRAVVGSAPATCSACTNATTEAPACHGSLPVRCARLRAAWLRPIKACRACARCQLDAELGNGRCSAASTRARSRSIRAVALAVPGRRRHRVSGTAPAARSHARSPRRAHSPASRSPTPATNRSRFPSAQRAGIAALRGSPSSAGTSGCSVTTRRSIRPGRRGHGVPHRLPHHVVQQAGDRARAKRVLDSRPVVPEQHRQDRKNAALCIA